MRNDFQWVHLSHTVRQDFKLCINFLQRTQAGISINLLTYRQPTHVYRSDASEHGLGGYCLASGRAWRFPLPADCCHRVSLNTLEFMACLICLWIDVLAGRLPPESCVLSQTDSTSAEGWLRKSNFCAETQPAQLVVARKVATTITDADCCLYSQWFPGDENSVADSLSHDFVHCQNNSPYLLSCTNTTHCAPPRSVRDLTAAVRTHSEEVTRRTNVLMDFLPPNHWL